MLVDPIGRLTAPSRMTIRVGLLRYARNDVIIPNHKPLTTTYLYSRFAQVPNAGLGHVQACLDATLDLRICPTSYFKNCMYGSLLASSCTLSALAMRAERACQEPSRN